MTKLKTRTKGILTAEQTVPLRAMTLLAGCMMAESAVMGLRITLEGSVRSIMTTRFCSPVVSRTQMKRSDSSVRVLKLILAVLTPRFWS
jgi:hypothetical protein